MVEKLRLGCYPNTGRKIIVFILIPEKHPSLDTTRDDANGNSDANQFMSVHHDFRV